MSELKNHQVINWIICFWVSAGSTLSHHSYEVPVSYLVVTAQSHSEKSGSLHKWFEVREESIVLAWKRWK